MPELKLTYFDFDGGRGETPRLAMSIGGVPFEDDRVKFGDWKALKPRTPFGGLPVLEVDGQAVAQSCGVCRFVGKLAGLYPDDPLQAAFCDETMDAVEEIGVKISASSSIDDEDEKKRAREALTEGPLTRYLTALQARLESRGGEYFADGRLTVADLRVFVWMRHLRSGKLDYVPTDLADRVAPLLARHFERVSAHPGVKAYYQERS
jgi:glutathione S-transferase